MSQLVRVQNFFLSTDGFGAGEGQSLEAPFGHADGDAQLPADLASWAFATASWPNRTEPGGSRGLDDYFTREFHRNIGAEIMGRNKFGPQRGPWTDHEWQGWWGDEPPFHTPVFVMTHHERPSFTLSDTTFHFVSGDPATVLAQALEAAGGKDVRLGGGADTVRQFLDAGVLAVDADLAAGLRRGHRPGGHQLVEGDDLGLDEAALEVGVDDAGGLRCRPALADGPGPGLLGAGGQVGLQAEGGEADPG